MKSRTLSMKRGFNLVEVVLAVGVIVFGLSALIGVCIIGMKNTRQSMGDMYASTISSLFFSAVESSLNADVSAGTVGGGIAINDPGENLLPGEDGKRPKIIEPGRVTDWLRIPNGGMGSYSDDELLASTPITVKTTGADGVKFYSREAFDAKLSEYDCAVIPAGDAYDLVVKDLPNYDGFSNVDDDARARMKAIRGKVGPWRCQVKTTLPNGSRVVDFVADLDIFVAGDAPGPNDKVSVFNFNRYNLNMSDIEIRTYGAVNCGGMVRGCDEIQAPPGTDLVNQLNRSTTRIYCRISWPVNSKFSNRQVRYFYKELTK